MSIRQHLLTGSLAFELGRPLSRAAARRDQDFESIVVLLNAFHGHHRGGFIMRMRGQSPFAVKICRLTPIAPPFAVKICRLTPIARRCKTPPREWTAPPSSSERRVSITRRVSSLAYSFLHFWWWFKYPHERSRVGFPSSLEEVRCT